MPPIGALPMATMSMVPSWAPSRCAASPLASELLMWSSILIRPLVFSWSALSRMPIVSLRGLARPTAVPALRTMGAWATAGPVKTQAIRDDRRTARHRCMTRSPRAVLETVGPRARWVEPVAGVSNMTGSHRSRWRTGPICFAILVGALETRPRPGSTARGLARSPLLPGHADGPGDRALLVRAARRDSALAGHPVQRRRRAHELAAVLGAQSPARPRRAPGPAEPGGRGRRGRSRIPHPTRVTLTGGASRAFAAVPAGGRIISLARRSQGSTVTAYEVR